MAQRVVAILGTLDSKGREYGFLKDRIESHGVATLVIDAGVLGPPPFTPEISAAAVASAAGADLATLAAANDRGKAVAAMGEGAARIVSQLCEDGRIDGIISMGGGGGTSIGTTAMKALPVGVPKLMISTIASGDVSALIGSKDIVMMPSIVDIAGINRLSSRILANAAGAVAGMVEVVMPNDSGDRPLIAATMFGVTTPCVTRARTALEEAGFEVLVFHATGAGGRSMEALIRDGFIVGVLDLTTTELADELVGGVLSAGPDRLEAAGAAGIPQVVSVGALDMVNFGGPGTVPESFQGRTFYQHNPQVTLMRTTAAENAELGRRIADKLNQAMGPTVVMLPRGGVSLIDVAGEPFHDPDADAALFDALTANLGENVTLVEMDTDINDPAFADAAVEQLVSRLGDKAGSGSLRSPTNG